MIGLKVLALAALLLIAEYALAQAHQPPKVEVDDYQWQYSDNPHTGNAESVAQGRRLYRSTCYICHLEAGGRGPDLRKSRLQGQSFMRVVINGKKGTQMPAWKGKLSEDEMWKILAYIESLRQ
jgi:mono/diheme cytochrome c family protein